MILAIDCGSTYLKAALFDDQLRRQAEDKMPVRYTVRDTERVEFDPEQIWQDLQTLIQRLNAPADAIKTVSLSSQAQTFTVLDSSNQPVTPFYSWQDKRAVAASATLTQRLGAEFHQHCSFPKPLPQLQVSKLLWLKPTGTVVTLPEFFALRLAGVRAVDANLAAMSGLYSQVKGDWWPAALDICGLRREQLGPVVPLGAAVAGQKLRVVFAGNDQTSGAIGNGVRAGQLLLTVGTALVVYRQAGTKPGPYHPGGCWGPYPGGFYELATRDEGCAALDWAISNLTPGSDPVAFWKIGTKAELGTAFFFPNRMGTTAAWCGSTDLAARARAVFEGISFSARQLIEDDLSVPHGSQTVRVTGGGSQDDWRLQLLADILRCRVERGTGDALLGAARLAAGVSAESVTSDTGKAFTPDVAAVERYERLYQQWRTL